jgi:hypothetical protein
VPICPTRVDVLLGTLVRFPAQWHRAFLDRLGFVRLSRNSQIVLVSGMLLLSVRSRNCRKRRRSSNWYSRALSVRF